MYTLIHKVDTYVYLCICKVEIEHGTMGVEEIALHANVHQVCLYICGYMYIYIHTYIYMYTYI